LTINTLTCYDVFILYAQEVTLQNETKAEWDDPHKLLQVFLGGRKSRILLDHFGNLNTIAKESDTNIRKVILGTTDRQLKQLRAAFLLGSALVMEKVSFRSQVQTKADVVDLVREFYRYSKKEELRVILVDACNQVKGIELVSTGSVDQVVARPRDVFGQAIAQDVSGIILVHNHPSGDPTPSPGDIKITKKMCALGKELNIPILDHIIIGAPLENGNEYTSLQGLGLI